MEDFNKKVNVYDIWRVYSTNDTDETKELGVFEGFIDEIALHLGGKYGICALKFEKFVDVTITKVNSDTIPMTHQAHIDVEGINKVGLVHACSTFEKRPVSIRESNYFNCFWIIDNPTDEMIEKRALSKLSEREKEVLGLK